MERVLKCEFNLDTASVEVRYDDGTLLSIYTPGVDEAMELPLVAQTEVDWLIYNDPITYVNLVSSGKLESYACQMTEFHGLQD